MYFILTKLFLHILWWKFYRIKAWVWLLGARYYTYWTAVLQVCGTVETTFLTVYIYIYICVCVCVCVCVFIYIFIDSWICKSHFLRKINKEWLRMGNVLSLLLKVLIATVFVLFGLLEFSYPCNIVWTC